MVGIDDRGTENLQNSARKLIPEAGCRVGYCSVGELEFI
jgi:hypothetical protein